MAELSSRILRACNARIIVCDVGVGPFSVENMIASRVECLALTKVDISEREEEK